MWFTPLHWTGTAMLHACGRESAKVRLIGSWTGTLAVSKRQAQSTLVLVSDCKALQQSGVGDEPLLLLPVMKLKHGVKLLIIDVVHGVLICPLTNIAEMTKRVADIAISLEPLIVSMSSRNKSTTSGLQSERNGLVWLWLWLWLLMRCFIHRGSRKFWGKKQVDLTWVLELNYSYLILMSEGILIFLVS